MKDGDPSAVHMTHDEACRARVATALAEDEHFNVKIKKAMARKQQLKEDGKTESKPDQEQEGSSSSSGGQMGGHIVGKSVVEEDVDLQMPAVGEEFVTKHDQTQQAMPTPVPTSGPVTAKRNREDDDPGDAERLQRADDRAGGRTRLAEGQGDDERLGDSPRDVDGDAIMAVENPPKGGNTMWSRFSHHPGPPTELVFEDCAEDGRLTIRRDVAQQEGRGIS